MIGSVLVLQALLGLSDRETAEALTFVIEPDAGLITAAELTKSSGPENSDGAVGARLIGMDPTIAGTSVDVLADSAYGSGERVK